MDHEMKLLQGQTALVTGASSGIGKAIAIEMGKQGASVVVNHPNDDDSAAVAVKEELEQLGAKSIVAIADISNETQVKKMFSDAISAFGTVDILVNNAGIQVDSFFPDMTLQKWQRVIDVNLTGHFLCAREAVNEFLKRGIVKERSRAAGKIIFISSVHDKIPWATHANYAASKGGLDMLMRTIAIELAPFRIRSNSISPGAIKTNINRAAWETKDAEMNLLTLIPYGRVGEPADIARIAGWLASDESDYITGTTIYADGGMTLYPGFAHGG
jgi:glucose 1-dehydrogenase